MDLICVKGGRYFSSYDALKECERSCGSGPCLYEKNSFDESIYNNPSGAHGTSSNTQEFDANNKYDEIFNPVANKNRSSSIPVNSEGTAMSVPKSRLLKRCPRCSQNTLQFNPETRLSICLNKECNPIIANTRLDPSNTTADFRGSDTSSGKTKKTAENRIEPEKPKKLLSPLPGLLATFILLFLGYLIGTGISIYSKTYIPLWLFLAFAVFFSVESRLFPFPTKIRILGNIYKILLNLSILFTFCLAAWSLFKLFTHDFAINPVIGSIIFVAEAIFCFWLCKMKVRNNSLWPSLTFTVFGVCLLIIVFAFAGVSPFADYKDVFWDKVSTWFASWLS
jgi:hypothetical protein